MDIYLFLEDRPEGGRAPLGGNYTVKQREKLLVANLYNLGDDLPWFDPEAHGTPEQRALFFALGVEFGVGGCWLP